MRHVIASRTPISWTERRCNNQMLTLSGTGKQLNGFLLFVSNCPFLKMITLTCRPTAVQVLPRFPKPVSPSAGSPGTRKPVDIDTESHGSETDYDVSTDSASSVHESRSCVWSRSGRHDLYDQLVSSPQTRFHAAHLFARYLNYVLGCPGTQSRFESGDAAQASDLYNGMTLVKWDVAVGCLALSIKVSFFLTTQVIPISSTALLFVIVVSSRCPTTSPPRLCFRIPLFSPAWTHT